MQILKKLSPVLWCTSLSFTPAGAQEWEMFTGTLIDSDQNGRVKTKTGFVNGFSVKDSTQYMEKPKIRHFARKLPPHLFLYWWLMIETKSHVG